MTSTDGWLVRFHRLQARQAGPHLKQDTMPPVSTTTFSFRLAVIERSNFKQFPTFLWQYIHLSIVNYGKPLTFKLPVPFLFFLSFGLPSSRWFQGPQRRRQRRFRSKIQKRHLSRLRHLSHQLASLVCLITRFETNINCFDFGIPQMLLLLWLLLQCCSSRPAVKQRGTKNG